MIVEKGDTVKVIYQGRYENGELFDSSDKGEYPHPLVFIVGEGQVVEGFDEAVLGMKNNREKEFIVEPEKGYGQIREDLKKEISIKYFCNVEEIQMGMVVTVKTPNDKKTSVKILAIEKDKVLVDFNHPLAGKKLVFSIKVVGIDKNNS